MPLLEALFGFRRGRKAHRVKERRQKERRREGRRRNKYWREMR
jgi:hypothetical protein